MLGYSRKETPVVNVRQFNRRLEFYIQFCTMICVLVPTFTTHSTDLYLLPTVCKLPVESLVHMGWWMCESFRGFLI